jgi:hypothetical protein
MYKKTYRFIFAVSLAASIHTVSACCIGPMWWYDTLRSNIGDRAAMIVTAGQTNVNKEVLFTDTLYFTEFFDRLKAAYASSDLVFVAKVTQAVSFMPAIDSLNQEVFESESVTVTIEEVLKGNPQPLTCNFISRDYTISQRWVIDSLTGEISVGIKQMSLNETHYASVLNDRYLFFLDENNFSSGENGTFERMLPGSCDQYSYAYKINRNNQIYYDGFEVDTLRKSIPNIPEITCKLSDFFKDVLIPFSIGTRPAINRNEASKTPAVTYDLLGKRIPRVARQTAGTTSGLYIYTSPGRNDKNRRGFLYNSVR